MNFWKIIAEIVAPIISAIGIIIVSILAIWGEHFKTKPRLVLEPANLEGEDTIISLSPQASNGFKPRRIPVTHYHLRVVNKSRILAKNVRVLCTGIYKKFNVDLEYKRVNTSVIQQFTWAPAETSSVTQNILKSYTLDLGRLQTDRFILTLYGYPNNFQGFILSGESMRIDIEVVADNFTYNEPYTFEIYFDSAKGNSLREQLRIISI